MSMDVRAAAVGRLSPSRVAERTFGLLGQGFVSDYLLAVGIMIIPAALGAWRMRSLAGTPLTGATAFARMFGPGFWLSGLLSFICLTLIYSSLSWDAAERLQGRTPSVAEKLSAGLRGLPALIGIGVLAYFALVFATLLLVVPALFLATCWSLVAPVVAVEKRGVFGGFGRSFELSRGARWSIFLIVLVYMIASIVLALASGVAVRMIFGATGNPFLMQGVAGPALWANLVVNVLLGSLLRVVAAVGLGVIYSELRGFDAGQLSDVFA